ncbi:MAG: DUF1800 family protein [Flavobacteriales bacterium]
MASLAPISGPLGKQRAAHLLRRATMGPRLQDINAFSSLTPQAAFNALVQNDPMPAFPKDPNTGTDWIYPNVPDPTQINDIWSDLTRCWWLSNVKQSGPNLTERMLWFYHTHIPVIMTRISWNPQLAVDYLRLLRHYALGNYKDLVKAICIDNAMLIHLDGNLNIKSVPQENFGREFLELFTVGKGPEVALGDYTNFSEQDVKALTKVFTGWQFDTTFQTVDPVTGIPSGKVKADNNGNATQHDVTGKQFSAAFSNQTIQTPNVANWTCSTASVYTELGAAVDMVFSSVNTAKHIVRRVYRQFVYFEITPTIETDIIEPLANTLMANNYDMMSILSILLQSEHFYDVDSPPTSDNSIGAIIKSPLDVTLGAIRFFELNGPNPTSNLTQHYTLYGQLLQQLSLQGLELFEPVDVAGYDPYFQVPSFHRYWISANYLANRYKFAELLINGFSSGGTSLLKLEVLPFVEANATQVSDPTILVQDLVEWLIPITIDQARFDYFKDEILLNNGAIDWTTEWATYQSTSNNTLVKAQLELLVKSMMQSPEYQLF